MTANGPDVIIGGAARSGTTSLYRWLDAHPEIAMAREKEVRFFDRHYDRGWGWYVEQLPDRQTAVVGEASPRYFTDPRAAERIAHDLPDVRMVFCLRDPVVRAYSDYWMDRQRGRGGATFESSLADEALHDRYVGTGHYARHLRRLQQLLPPAQVLTVTFDELTEAPEALYLRLCRFLGVAEVVPETVGANINGHGRFRSRRLRSLARGWPKPLRDAIGRLNTKCEGYPAMAGDTERRLREHFAPHDAELASMLDRPVPWPR